jgi:hypothetical protein
MKDKSIFIKIQRSSLHARNLYAELFVIQVEEIFDDYRRLAEINNNKKTSNISGVVLFLHQQYQIHNNRVRVPWPVELHEVMLFLHMFSIRNVIEK